MRTECINLYRFNELSEKAQARAIEDWRACVDDYAWSRDYRVSLEAFADHIGVTLTNWQVGGSGSYVNWRGSFDTEGMSPARLSAWVWNNWLAPLQKGKYYSNHGEWIDGKYRYKSRRSRCQFEIVCPFTGYCADDELLWPLKKFVDCPYLSTIEDLIDECFHEFIRAWEADMEHQNSDEYISETLIANEYEFTKKGKFYG